MVSPLATCRTTSIKVFHLEFPHLGDVTGNIFFVIFVTNDAFVALIILNLVAIVNLLLFMGLLLVKKPRTTANKILALMILDPIISMVYLILVYHKMVVDYPASFYAAYLYDFLWAPLFYYYTILTLRQTERISPTTFLRFTLFFAGCAYFVWFWLQPGPYQEAVLAQTQTNDYPLPFTIMDYLTLLQSAISLAFFYIITRRHNRKASQAFSDAGHVSARWMQEFVVFACAILAVSYFPIIINAKVILSMICVPVASLALYCYLIYKAVFSPIMFSEEELKIIEQTDEALEVETAADNDAPTEVDQELVRTFEGIMSRDKPFLLTDLNIQAMAESCNTRIHTLSTCINRHYKKNFFDLVNSYRIDEAKKLLNDPDQQKYSIATIAEMSGFSSRSAFYTAFKKNTDTTPGEYLKSVSRA